MRDWFQGFGIAPEKIHDLTWWEEHQHSDRLSFVSTPCQHWTRRMYFVNRGEIGLSLSRT